MRSTLTTWFSCLLLLFSVSRAFASHYSGGEIMFACNPAGGPQSYTITLALYFDCTGAPSSTIESICIRNGTSVGSSTTINVNAIPSTIFQPNPTEITPVCLIAVNTPCQPGTDTYAKGYKRVLYQGTTTITRTSTIGSSGIPSALSTPVILSTSNCCRNFLINASGSNFYIETKIFRLQNPCDNNSPAFNDNPILRFCVNTQRCYAFNAFDPDGDSLVYNLATALDAPLCGPLAPLTYNTGYSATQPFGSASPFTFNPATGEFCVTPTIQGNYVFSMEVSDYRYYFNTSGNRVPVKMSTVQRDVQVFVDVCATANPAQPTFTLFDNGPNDTTVIACQNTCFNLTVTPPASMGGNMNLKVVSAAFGPPINGTCNILPANCMVVTTPYTAGVGVNSVGTTPVDFGFCFNPIAAQIGAIYTLRLDARYCIGPDEILAQKVYKIIVAQPPIAKPQMRCTSADGLIPATSLTVTGNNMSPNDSVYVYRANSPAGPFNNLAIIKRDKLSAVATSYSHTDLTATPSSNIYWYKMGVKPACALQIVQSTDTINNIKLTGSITAGNIVTLNWNKFTDIANGVESYKVMRDVGSGFALLTTVTDTFATDNLVNFPCSVTNAKYQIVSEDEMPFCSTNSNTIQLNRTITLPQAVSVIPPSPCNATTIQLVFNSPILCSSVSASDFTVTGPGGPYTVTSATGVTACTGGIQDTLEITFTPAIITSGVFNLAMVGTITDPCGNTINNSNFNFNIPSFTASASVTQQVLCFGYKTGSASATIVGGQGNYTFDWYNAVPAVIQTTNTSATSNSISGLGAGTYSVIITDSKGCKDTATVTITEPATPVDVTLSSQTNVLCKGNTTGVINTAGSGGTVGTGYSFTLQPGATTNGTGSFTGLGAGTYSVIITDGNGCKDTLKNVIITEPATAVSASVNTTTPVSCKNGSNGTITMNGAGGTGTLTYTLTPGSVSNTTGSFTGLTAGTYSVVVKDANNCSVTVTNIIITQPSPISVATLVRDSVNCNGGSDGSINVTGSGGNTGGYTYTLNPGTIVNATGTFTGLSAGIYSINIKDTKNCDTTFNVTISEPSVVTIAETHIDVKCKGDATGSITITGGGGTVGAAGYTYSLNGGTFQTSNIFSSLIAGNYTIQVKDKYGCVSAVANVTITEPAAALSVSVGTTTDPKCNNGTDGAINVSAAGGTTAYSYTLSPGSVTNATGSFTGLGAGTYTVTVTDANNCTITTANITLNNPTALAITSTVAQHVLCNGGNTGSINVSSVTGGQGTPYNITISPNPNSQSFNGNSGTFTNLPAGTYTITATDANSCTQTGTLTITEPTVLTLTSSIIDVTCNGLSNGSIQATASDNVGGYTYTLTPGAVVNSTGLFTGLASGNYNIAVTNTNGCSTNINVTVNQPNSLVATGGTASTKCASSSDATIQIGVTGGNTGGFTYILNPGAVSNTTGLFTNLGAGSYVVTVTDSKGCNDTANVLITSPAPIQPTTLVRATVTTTDATNGTTLIEWNASVSANIKEYVVDWFNPINNTWIPIDTLNALSTTHTLNTTTNPNQYRVSVVDICGNRTTASPEHHTVFLSGTAAGLDKQISLSWTSYVGWSVVNSYKVYRRDVTNGGTSALLATVTGNSYTDSNVRCKVNYEYIVEAVGDANSSSNAITITPQDIVMPNGVAIKTATVEDNKNIRINWAVNNSPDAYQYRLYRFMGDAPSAQEIAKIPLTDTTYLDTKVNVQGLSYTYFIMVEDSCGGLSTTSNVGKSILLKGGVGSGYTNMLNWNAYREWTGGVLEYEVYRYTTLQPSPTQIASSPTQALSVEDDITNFTDENAFFYYVIAKENGGSQISLSNVRAVVQPPRFFIPSAFTPGGANPSFNLTGSFIKSYTLRVFDRWGKQIFETSDKNKGWEGGDYTQGVYAYTLKIIGMDDKVYERAGTVTLLR